MSLSSQDQLTVTPPVHAGRASVWIGLVALASWIGVVAIGSTVHATFGRAKVDSPIYYALGVWIVITILMSLFGLVMAIAGLCSPRGTSRGAALAGLMLNLALPIGILLLTVLAMLADPSPQPILKPNDVDGPTRRSLATGGVVLLVCVVGVFVLLRRITGKVQPSMDLAFDPEVLARAKSVSTQSFAPPETAVTAASIRCQRCPQMLPTAAQFCRRCGCRVGASE